VKRRSALAWLGAMALGTVARPAAAGTYLEAAGLLVGANRRDAEALRKRPTDKDLAKVIHTVASARSTAAADMVVPEKVAKAHPHLLLTLAKIERAALAAREGNVKVLLEQLDAARTEETLFRSVLKELGFSLGDA
jgi:hypothetical protein